MADVKTLTVDGVKYNIKDAKARTDIANKQDKLPSGTTGQFLRKTSSGIAFENIPWDDKLRYVTTLPANPTSGVFYFVKE